MNTVFRLLLLCALGLPIAFPARADSPVEPAACKTPGARRITIAHFQFSPTELQTFKDNHPQPHAVSARRGPARRATLAEAIAALRPPVAQQATPVPAPSARVAVVQQATPLPASSARVAVVATHAPLTVRAPIGATHTPVGPPHDLGGDATCGVVDFWLYAAVDAYLYCNAADKGNGQAYFEVTSPASFNAVDHHDQYANFEPGLEGSCYVCVPPPELKPLEPVTAPRGAVRTAQPATGP